MAKDGADRELKKLFRFLFPPFVSAERGPRAESLADHQRRKRGAVDCTAAQAVAAGPPVGPPGHPPPQPRGRAREPGAGTPTTIHNTHPGPPASPRARARL